MRGKFLNLTEMELDKNVYRIMPQEYVFTLFSDRQNVLSQVHNWKDKFESFQLRLGGVLNGESFSFGFKDDFVGLSTYEGNIFFPPSCLILRKAQNLLDPRDKSSNFHHLGNYIEYHKKYTLATQIC